VNGESLLSLPVTMEGSKQQKTADIIHAFVHLLLPHRQEREREREVREVAVSHRQIAFFPLSESA
jgi:hypothetical protein